MRLLILGEEKVIEYIDETKQKLSKEPVNDLNAIKDSLLEQIQDDKSYRIIEVECIKDWCKFHQFKMLFISKNSIYVEYIGTFKY